MDNIVMSHVESYVSYLKTQYQGDTIPTITYDALVYDNLEPARKLGGKEYEAVLNNVAKFAEHLYRTNSRELKPYARHYILALVKELTALKSDVNVIQVLRVTKSYDYEAWEMCITHCSPAIRDANLQAERIIRYVSDAVKGIVYGVITGAIYIAVRVLLKI